MREILFKAKRIDNGEWVEGNIVISEDAEEGYKAIIIPKSNSNMFTKGGSKGDLGFENWYKVDRNTICQYTGLTDNDGTKIWEHDIVEIPTENGYFELEWADTEGKWRMNNEVDRFTVDFDNYWSHEVTVIGNIFDNPELLEGGVVMQNDLISRSALCKRINEIYKGYMQDEAGCTPADFESIVDDMPTAYDVEVVISKMEKEKEKSIYDYNSIIGEKNVWAKAIEYVRNGGKE